MIVQQQINVLPAGCVFKIMDEHRPAVTGMIARSDKTPMFDNIRDSELYYKVYSRFHVTLLDVNVNTDGLIFIINVR